MSENNTVNRRNFIKRTARAAAGISLLPSVIPAASWGRNGLPNERITLGFIGVGKQGTGLLRGFLNTSGTQVTAVCDVDELKLNRAKNIVEKHYSERESSGRYHGCAAYRDFRDLIARKDIDAVVIATPDHWHAIQVNMAAQTGKDIYCEKPLSLTIAEARAMVHEVRKWGRVFQTGSMQRSDGKFRFACELVQNGYIGEVKNVRVSIRTGFYNHPHYCDLPAEPVPAELEWDLWLGPAPRRPFNAILSPPMSFNGWAAWRNYIDYSGGGMTDWGAHHFDIAQWGLGMDGSGPVEIIPPDGKDYPHLTYRYANGVVLAADFDDGLIRFTGTEGIVEVNRRYLKAWPAGLLKVRLAPGDRHLYKSLNHHTDWLQAVKSRSKPICDVEIGCRSVAVCHLGNIAVQLGRPLKWNPDKEVFHDDREANRKLTRSKRNSWRI